MTFRILALLLLWSVMLMTNPAQAALSCTAGKVPGWKVTAIANPTPSWNACTIGQEFATPQEAGGECPKPEFISGGVAGGYQDIRTKGGVTYAPNGPTAWTITTQYPGIRRIPNQPDASIQTISRIFYVGEQCITPVEDPEEDCSEKEGQPVILSGTGYTGNMCDPRNSCQVSFTPGDAIKKVYPSTSGTGGWVGQTGTFTGQQCGGDPEADDTEVPEGMDDEGPCGTIDGVKVCAGEEGPNCGTVNGQPFCAGSGPDDGECVTTPGGQMVCIQPGSGIDEDVATPPGPNNGATGESASPNASIQNGSTTAHYYNSSTVSNSTHDEGFDGDGVCEAGEQETADCEEQPSGECEDDPGTPANECGTGRGKGSVKGKGGTAKTYRESAESFMNKVKGSAIGQSLSGIGQGMPAGECPPIEMDLPLLGYLGTTAHCELAQELYALSILFIALYALLGVRIVMSA